MDDLFFQCHRLHTNPSDCFPRPTLVLERLNPQNHHGGPFRFGHHTRIYDHERHQGRPYVEQFHDDSPLLRLRFVGGEPNRRIHFAINGVLWFHGGVVVPVVPVPFDGDPSGLSVGQLSWVRHRQGFYKTTPCRGLFPSILHRSHTYRYLCPDDNYPFFLG